MPNDYSIIKEASFNLMRDAFFISGIRFLFFTPDFISFSSFFILFYFFFISLWEVFNLMMNAVQYLKHKRLERELRARERRLAMLLSVYAMALVYVLYQMGKLYF